MSSISFDNVYLLLIAVPLIVLFTVPFALAIRKDNRNGHNITSHILHIVISVFIAFAAAGTSFTRVLTETDVYVVADVSHSARYNLDTVDEYIRNLELPGGAKLGLVCFGKDFQLVSELGNPKDLPSVKTATVDDSETNISAALNYTGTLFGTDVIKRIVLITDGKQTDLRSENSIRRAVDSLETQNIKVDAIFLDDNPSEENKEVQISGVTYTGNVYQGSEQTVQVAVQTSFDTEGVMTLTRKREGETEDVSQNVNLTLGLNNVSFDLDTSEPGTFDYEVTVSAEGDTGTENNTYRFTQAVVNEMKVLIVTEDWADLKSLVGMYADKGTVDVYERDTATTENKNSFVAGYADNRNITFHLNDLQVPSTIEALCRYDEIVLSNLDITGLTDPLTFVESLDTVVATYGKSLVTMGNLSIQNRNDESLQQLSNMLPVNYGNRDEARLFTFVIDSSRSMDTLWHLATAKEVATRLVDLLSDTDSVCIVKFDAVAELILPATPLKDRDSVKEHINSLEVRNGTVIGSGLQRAYEQIQALQYSEKQVMLFTDGLNFGADPYTPANVVRNMYNEGIFTAVFDVGRMGDEADGSNITPEYSSAKTMLQNLAKIGSGNEGTSKTGNYFYSNNLEYLDESLFENVADNLTEDIITQDTSVNVKILRDSVLDGIDESVITNIPVVSKYVYSGAKPSASTVLTVNHERKSGAVVEKPLFAHWDYGNGRVSAFTSAPGAEWTAKWNTGLKDTFFDNVFETSVPEEKHDVPYSVSVMREGKYTTVEGEFLFVRSGATLSFAVTSTPGGEAVEGIENTSGNLRAFRYTFETADVGKYTFRVTYRFEGEEFITQRTVDICYLEEYDAFTVFDPSELHRAIDGRGTVSHDGVLKIENSPDEVGKYVFDFTVPLLITAVVLFVIDITIRKLKWEDVVSFFSVKKKDKEDKE